LLRIQFEPSKVNTIEVNVHFATVPLVIVLLPTVVAKLRSAVEVPIVGTLGLIATDTIPNALEATDVVEAHISSHESFHFNVSRTIFVTVLDAIVAQPSSLITFETTLTSNGAFVIDVSKSISSNVATAFVQVSVVVHKGLEATCSPLYRSCTSSTELSTPVPSNVTTAFHTFISSYFEYKLYSDTTAVFPASMFFVYLLLSAVDS
jgi:hypothetical protein